MEKDKIIEQLKNAEQYYGEYSQQFLSNSDVKVLKTESSAKEFRSAKKFTETELKNLEIEFSTNEFILKPIKKRAGNMKIKKYLLLNIGISFI